MQRWTMLCIAVLVAVGVAVAALSQRVRPTTPPSRAPQSAAAPAPLRADDLFDDTTLHDVWIKISAADLQQLREHAHDNTYYKVGLEWRGVKVADVGIRSRGGATRSGPKPGLRVDFNRYQKGQTFLGLKGLVLDNSWHDASMMRERVGMLLFRRMGIPAPREAHARLYLGDARTFAGVYAIVEEVDDTFLQRNFGEDDGYLFEYHRIDGYHLEDLESFDEYAKRFDPKTHENDGPVRIFGPLRDLVRVINRSSPDELPAAIAPYLDLDRFLTFVAVTNYLAVWDSFLGNLGMANFFVYKFKDRMRFEFFPWDQDHTFTSLDFPPWHNVPKNVLMRKLWANPASREQYMQKLMEVAASADGWLAGEIDREYRQIRAAVLSDPVKSLTNEEFEKMVAFMKRFGRERSAGVRDFVARIRADPAAERLGNP